MSKAKFILAVSKKNELNSRMENWKTYKVEDLAKQRILIVGDGYRAKNSELSKNGLPFARGANINQGFLFDNAECLGAPNLHKAGDKISKIGDVVFTSKGTVGRFAFVGEDTKKFVYSPQLCYWRVLDEKFIHPRYLYFWMYSREFFEQYNGVKNQTDMADYVSLINQRRFHITLPPIEEQKAIAKILSSLDDKIELNRQMNATLEAIARALFKAWFVDFEPVRANSESRPSESASPEIAKLFPSEFENDLPKGWRKGKVRDICKVNANTLNNKDTVGSIKYIEISEVSKGVVNNISMYKKGEEPSRAKRKLLHGDVAISTVRPDRGSYFMAFHPEKDLIASTGFAVFTATSVPFSFLYIFLTDAERLTFYGKRADGAAYPAVNPSAIMDIDLTIPSDDALKQFHSTIEAVFAIVGSNLKETKTLAQIRDSLLPRLMSGKIRVGESDGCYNAGSIGV